MGAKIEPACSRAEQARAAALGQTGLSTIMKCKPILSIRLDVEVATYFPSFVAIGTEIRQFATNPQNREQRVRESVPTDLRDSALNVLMVVLICSGRYAPWP